MVFGIYPFDNRYVHPLQRFRQKARATLISPISGPHPEPVR